MLAPRGESESRARARTGFPSLREQPEADRSQAAQARQAGHMSIRTYEALSTSVQTYYYFASTARPNSVATVFYQKDRALSLLLHDFSSVTLFSVVNTHGQAGRAQWGQ